MEQYKYDVFISYSRDDYMDGKTKKEILGNPISAIRKLFDENGVKYWIDKDGIYSGLEFMPLISDAIADSSILVFVSSQHSNKSKWTPGEILEALDCNKLIIPIRIDDSTYNKTFRIGLRPFDYINYYENPKTALLQLLRAVNKEKDRLKKDISEEKRRQQVQLAKAEIKNKAKEFHALVGQQDYVLKEIYAKHKLLGIESKRCPVCNNEVPLQLSFCNTCSWQFPKLFSIDGNEEPICDDSQLKLARSNWRRLDRGVQLITDIDRLKSDNAQFETERKSFIESISRYKTHSQMLETTIEKQQKKIVSLQNLIAQQKETLQKKDEDFDAILAQLTIANKKIKDLEKSIEKNSSSTLAASVKKATSAKINTGFLEESEWHQIIRECKLDSSKSIFKDDIIRHTLNIEILKVLVSNRKVPINNNQIDACRTIGELKNLFVSN